MDGVLEVWRDLPALHNRNSPFFSAQSVSDQSVESLRQVNVGVLVEDNAALTFHGKSVSKSSTALT